MPATLPEPRPRCYAGPMLEALAAVALLCLLVMGGVRAINWLLERRR